MSESQSGKSGSREWLTVAQAAAALNVSEKTLRRRIKAGEIEARKVPINGGGLAWHVHLKADASASATDKRNGHGLDTQRTNATDVPEPQRTHFERENDATDTQRPNVPEGSDTRNGQRNGQNNDRELIELLREQLAAAAEREKRVSLQIEAANRQAAEATAALREYLKLQAKALPSPEKMGQIGTDTSTRNDAVSTRDVGAQEPKTSATGKHLSSTQNAKTREMRPLWKVILGVR